MPKPSAPYKGRMLKHQRVPDSETPPWRARRGTAVAALRTTVLLATVALGAGACSGGEGPARVVASVATGKPSTGTSSTGTSSTGTAAASGKGDMLAFARCMRRNGLPQFPDPKPGGGIAFAKGGAIDPTSAQFKRAEDKCKEFKGNGAKLGPGPGNPESDWSSADKLKYAKCMREKGVPKFPDPNADGGFGPFVKGGAVDPESPQFKQAQAACKQYQPVGLRNGTPRKPGGPGGGS